MRGRKPKTAAERALTGNAGHRPIPTDAVVFEAAAPLCPRSLTAAEKAIWRRTVKKLVAARAITTADEFVLLAYCEAFAGYLEQKEVVRKTGGATLVRDGVPYQNAAVFNLHKYRSETLAYASRLGLTPLDRARVRAAGDPESTDDPFARFDTPRAKPSQPRPPARARPSTKKKGGA